MNEERAHKQHLRVMRSVGFLKGVNTHVEDRDNRFELGLKVVDVVLVARAAALADRTPTDNTDAKTLWESAVRKKLDGTVAQQLKALYIPHGISPQYTFDFDRGI